MRASLTGRIDMTFEEAFDRLLGHEGVLSLDKLDPGNWSGGKVGHGKLLGTKYGISAMSYPNEDIVGLTVERAREIIKADFWGPSGAEALPDEVRFDVLDTAVHMGVRTAIRMLQRAVGETDDGVMGPLTLQAVSNMPPSVLRLRFNGSRLFFLASLPAWTHFNRGWARRIASNLLV